MNAEMDISKNQWRSTGGLIVGSFRVIEKKFFLNIAKAKIVQVNHAPILP